MLTGRACPFRYTPIRALVNLADIYDGFLLAFEQKYGSTLS